jgi:hypothetical protein
MSDFMGSPGIAMRVDRVLRIGLEVEDIMMMSVIVFWLFKLSKLIIREWFFTMSSEIFCLIGAKEHTYDKQILKTSSIKSH